MRKVLILFEVVILCACVPKNQNNKNEQQIDTAINPSTPIDDIRYIDSLIDAAIFNGNEAAYSEVATYHFIEDRQERFLYVSLIVANKFGYPAACYDTYEILNGYRTGEQIKSLDPKTKSLALFYLLRAYEGGLERAKYEVDEIFGERKEKPKSSSYLQEFSRQ